MAELNKEKGGNERAPAVYRCLSTARAIKTNTPQTMAERPQWPTRTKEIKCAGPCSCADPPSLHSVASASRQWRGTRSPTYPPLRDAADKSVRVPHPTAHRVHHIHNIFVGFLYFALTFPLWPRPPSPTSTRLDIAIIDIECATKWVRVRVKGPANNTTW